MRHIGTIRTYLAHWWSFAAVRVLVGALVSAAFLLLALRAVPADQIWQTLGQVNLLFVGLTLLSIVVNAVAKAARWKVLLGPEGRAIHLWDLLGALLVGQMLNTFIPTRIGDLSRSYTIGQRGPGMSFVLGTVVVEKLVDLIAFGLLVCGLLLLIPLPEWAVGPAYQVLAVGVIVVALIVLLTRRRFLAQVFAWVGARFKHRFIAKLIAAAQSAFQSGSVLGRPAEVSKLVVLTALIWGTAILNNYLLFVAFQLVLPLSAAVLLLVGLQLGISLPSLPGTIGVFEYVCVVVLAVFAVERSTALSYGILLHAVVMVPSTLVGLLCMLLMRTSWRPPPVVPPIGEPSR